MSLSLSEVFLILPKDHLLVRGTEPEERWKSTKHESAQGGGTFARHIISTRYRQCVHVTAALIPKNIINTDCFRTASTTETMKSPGALKV